MEARWLVQQQLVQHLRRRPQAIISSSRGLRLGPAAAAAAAAATGQQARRHHGHTSTGTRTAPSSSLRSVPGQMRPRPTLSSASTGTGSTRGVRAGRGYATAKHPEGFRPPTREELEELRESVREFTRREIPEELAAQTDSNNDFPHELWGKLGSAGLLGVTADEAYGGLGMGYQAHCVVMEELSAASGSIALSYAAHAQLCVNQLCLNGSPAQKDKYLPALIAGSKVGALAMSEVGAGSDVVSMKTTATKTAGGYILNGSKMWITNGPDADLIVVYAKTEPTAGSKGITAFIVAHPSFTSETSSSAAPARRELSAGFSVARKLDKLGMRGSNTGELVLEDVFVPDAAVLGPVNAGVRVLMEGLDLERLVLSAGPLGLMRRTLDLALPYTHAREQFGVPLASLQLVQALTADIYTRYSAARAFTHAVAAHVDAHHADPAANFGIVSRDCTAAILFAAEAGTRAALDGIQLMGGMGYMSEVPMGRILRDAKLYEIGAGTTEVRKLVIGRSFKKEYS